MEHSSDSFLRIGGKEPLLLPGVVVADAQGTIRSVNEMVCRLFGYSKVELVGASMSKLMPKSLADQHSTYLKRYFATGGATRGTVVRVVQGVRKDGSEVKIRLVLSLIPSEVEPLISGMIDEVVEHTFTLITDGAGYVLSVAGNTEETCGYTHAALKGQNVSILCPRNIAGRHQEMMTQFKLGTDSAVVGHTRNRELRHKNGHLLPLSLEISVAMSQGILEWFQAKFTEVEILVEGVIVANEEGVLQSVDSMVALVFGYEVCDLIGRPCTLIFPKVELQEGKRVLLATHHDGSQFFVTLSLEIIAIAEGTHTTHYRGVILRIPTKIVHRQPSKRLPEKNDDDAKLLLQHSMDWYDVSERELGRGYSGIVRMGTYRLTGLPVALKVLTKRQMSADGMEYPPRELLLLKKIHRHPNIVRLLHSVVLENAVVLIMEFVQGGELLDFVSQHDHLSEGLARRFMHQIVPAVEFLHRLDIVHRDLKLENILLDVNGNIKIIDLGFGNFYGRTGLLTTFCGSADYASPELWEGKPYLGPEVDVWALGIILYIMVTGFIPFNSAAHIIAMRYHWPPQQEISMALRNLLGQVFCSATTRCSVSAFREHPWMTEDGTRPCEGTLLRDDRHAMVPNELITTRMEELGFPRSSVLHAIQAGEHNQLSTTYVMLEQQLEVFECERGRLSLSQCDMSPSASPERPLRWSSSSNSPHKKCVLC